MSWFDKLFGRDDVRDAAGQGKSAAENGDVLIRKIGKRDFDPELDRGRLYILETKDGARVFASWNGAPEWGKRFIFLMNITLIRHQKLKH